MTAWNVIASGPGNRNFKPNGGPIVAVNLQIFGPWTAAYWCCDESRWMLRWADNVETHRQRDSGCVCWIGPRKQHSADMMRQKGWEVDGTHNHRTLYREQYGWPKPPTIPPKSIWTAIARVMEAGAKEVRLWGVDMCGEGDVHPRTGRRMPAQAPRDGGWAKRWEWEAGLLSQIIEAAGVRGVTVERHGLVGEASAV